MQYGAMATPTQDLLRSSLLGDYNKDEFPSNGVTLQYAIN